MAVAVEAGITFLFAPAVHPGMRHAGPVRRELGCRPSSNVLGPLINPAHPTSRLVGSPMPDSRRSSPTCCAVGAPRRWWRGATTGWTTHHRDHITGLDGTGRSRDLDSVLDPQRLGIPGPGRRTARRRRGGERAHRTGPGGRSTGAGARRCASQPAAAALAATDSADALPAALARCAEAIDSGRRPTPWSGGSRAAQNHRTPSSTTANPGGPKYGFASSHRGWDDPRRAYLQPLRLEHGPAVLALERANRVLRDVHS